MLKHRPYRIALIVSIAIHLLTLLLYKPLAGISGLIDLAKAEVQPEEPLTFELVDPYQQPQELVETPEEARLDAPPDDAQFLSDKNARAQDMLDNPNMPEGLSFSEGISDYKIFAGGAAGDPEYSQEQAQQDQPGETDRGENAEVQEGEQDPYQAGDVPIWSQALAARRQKFSKEVLRGASNPGSTLSSPFSDDANWDNQQSSADLLGGISLSTYEWEYAPYILYMKRRLGEHWYPPAAYYRMGAVSGEVYIQIVLRRDGTLQHVQVLGNKGHDSLVEPCLNAVRASAPFKPLPEHFPDARLELNWTFIYLPPPG
ncbi:energy transducer TonB [candidate division KSB1 bacterium]|nr:energy transducer TonB [candidate division KSB1 bacterium]